jgi:MoaA/NifB/PqqE/SkfB family radical SAM enzyme
MKLSNIKRELPLVYSLARRKLAFEALPIFATNRCNSKCTICHIWQKTPKIDLDPEIIRKILRSKVISKYSTFILTGGEFILHPKHEEIISLLNEYGNKYILLSNGLLPDHVVKIVRKFKVPHLSLSLDGPSDTYIRTRGVDGYSKVVRILQELQGDDVRLSIGYTVSPWNTREDLLHVMKLCEKYNVGLSVGYYCQMEYYDIEAQMNKPYSVEDLMAGPYHSLYPSWISGNLKMPCFSIFLRPVIRPNGDVELCEPLQIKLGNLYTDSLEEIWQRKNTRALHRRYVQCNKCWHDAQRTCDLRIFSVLKTFVPTSLIKMLLPEDDWKKIYRHVA